MDTSTLIAVLGIGFILILFMSGAITGGSETEYVEYNENTVEDTVPEETENSTEETETASYSESDDYSDLRYPEDVKEVLSLYDYNYDGKIEFLDEDSDYPDGQEEFIAWAVTAGLDSSDAAEITAFFMNYDEDGDWYLDRYELDMMFYDYYN